MTPRIESVWFRGDSNQYPRLAQVLEYTARHWCPEWAVSVRRIGETQVHSRVHGRFAGDNHWKLEHWAAAAREAQDGQRLLLLDTDTFVTAPLDALWDEEFDIAYTERRVGARLPLNAGVIALRVNDRSRRFMDQWLERDREFLENPEAASSWRKAYGGQNQASLGSLLRGPEALALHVAPLPCRVWNCEDLEWESFDPRVTRIVHVKSGLRMAIFNIGASGPKYAPLEKLWRALEREATSASAGTARPSALPTTSHEHRGVPTPPSSPRTASHEHRGVPTPPSAPRTASHGPPE